MGPPHSQIAKNNYVASPSSAKRRPGAPKGNRNAVRHGAYTAEGRAADAAREAEVEALLAGTRALIARIDRIVARRKARAAARRKVRLFPRRPAGANGPQLTGM